MDALDIVENTADDIISSDGEFENPDAFRERLETVCLVFRDYENGMDHMLSGLIGEIRQQLMNAERSTHKSNPQYLMLSYAHMIKGWIYTYKGVVEHTISLNRSKRNESYNRIDYIKR